MAKKPWYLKGEEGREKSSRVDKEQQERAAQQRGPMRFWLDNDSSAKGTFLDTPNFFFHEHNLKLAGKWFNYETCIKEFDTCPPCENGERSSYVVAGTILVHKPWKDRNDKQHKVRKMLFVAKGRARQRLLKQLDYRDGDLKFCVYELSRGTSNTEANTGEDFEFLKRLTKKQVKSLVPADDILKDGKEDYEDVDDFLKPFDYEEMFAPKSAKDLRELVGGETPVGAEDDAPSEEPPDEEEPDGEVTSIDDLI
jgi:hypothetical protein